MAKPRSTKQQHKQQQAKRAVNPYLFLGGILLLTIIVYAGAMEHDFLYQFDDDLYVTNNPDIQALTWDNIQKIFTKSYVGLYLPITMLSLMVDHTLFGLDPQGFHVVNLIFHLLNTVLVFILIRKLKPGIYVASVVAFVFALHPLHVESVTWISERKDVVYVFFYLAGLITYLNYLDRKKAGDFIFTIILFMLSLLSKAVAVSFPLFLLAFDWYRGRKILNLQVILEKAPFFALSLAIGLLGIYFTSAANDTSTPEIAWAFRPFIVSDAFMMYVWKFIAPFNLMNYYYYPDISDGKLPTRFYISAGIFVLAAIITIFATIKSKTKKPDILLGLIMFLIPTIFILQLIPAGRAYAADRYTYVSYIGLSYIFAILTAGIIRDKARAKTQIRATIIGMIAFLAIGFSYLTWDRNKDWEDTFVLFNDLMEKNPDHYHPYLVRGITHIQFGNREEALADYNKSLSLNPNSAKALSNRASVKGMLGDYEGAFEDANRALEIRPGYENALSNRATAYIYKEDFNAAIQDIDAILTIDSTNTAVIRKRIMVFEKMNDYEGVLESYLMLIHQEPDNYEHYGKAGEACYRLNRNEEAIRYFTKAVEMNRKYYQPLMLRGNAYFKIRDYKNALDDFTRFARITNDPSAYYNAGMCNMRLNNIDKACESWQTARDLGHNLASDRIRENCK